MGYVNVKAFCYLLSICTEKTVNTTISMNAYVIACDGVFPDENTPSTLNPAVVIIIMAISLSFMLLLL
jgi:hypothetical protein